MAGTAEQYHFDGTATAVGMIWDADLAQSAGIIVHVLGTFVGTVVF